MGAADEDKGTQGLSGGEEKIFVSVRLRPLNDKETGRNDVSDWECINDNTVIYRNNLSGSERSMYPTAYVFDRVFRPDCTTRHVYEEGAKEVALAVVRGINSSVFAYGQTSSGKTYTMSGITEYTVADIYDHIEKRKEREYILKFSAMEIYNESVRDLLSMDTTPLRLLDDPERGTVVERLTEETLRDWNHFKELLSICEAQRQIGETSMNETSSRSHQILRLTIESSAREFLGNDKSSSLSASVNFVDLAGSERASQASSAGMRLKEGCHINRSLLTLGTVIRKLSKGRNGHIPFRDSKLTRILQSSLGGNARTAIICTISPARSHVEQSRNTLVFASCAKEVMTNARVNVVVSDKALVKQLQRELARLESELRSAGSNPVTSDSAEILREKDLQIEKLVREVAELNQQLELSQSQVENLLRMAEDDRSSTLSGDPDHQYPKLRVQSSFRSLNSYPYSPASEDRHSVHIGVRSFDASQCSAGDNSSNISDENFINLTDFQERFVQTNSTLELSNGDASAENDQDMMDGKVENLVSFGNICKEVQCITDADSTTNSQILENSPLRYADSNVSSVSSPNINTGTSTLTQVETDDREHKDLPSEEQEDLNCVNSDFVTPVPGKPTSWLLSKQMHRSRSLKMIRSRSCGAIITVVSPCFSERIANSATTPMMSFQKDFTKRSEASQGKLAELENSPNVEQLLRNVSSASVGSAAVDDSQLQSIDASIDWKSTPSVINSDAGMKYMMDYLEQETTPDANECRKSVKDIGLDPIQDDSDTATKWPSDFKRLQMEIIELWHACSVSLIHRTYFFLLFKGDPADSFYMEVEIRKLNFLKDTFSRGDETMVDGRRLSLASSKRAVNQERQMLCKRMQKQLSREEKENLFLKWGIPLASSNRRMQLMHRLWAKTTDMDHIIESATLIAKLIGFDGQEQTLKQMFGLLNFTPQHPSKRKSSVWIRSVLSLL